MLQDKLFKPIKLLASDTKHEDYTYMPKAEAITKKFIQFNKHAVTSIIIDVDHVSLKELEAKLTTLPTPSMVVHTDKGYHVHYVLKYPVGHRNRSLVLWANRIKSAMLKEVGGDIHANGVAPRVYRNPWKHITDFTGKEYTLKELASYVTLSTPKQSKESKGTFRKSFKDVKVGERHNTMFDYLRYNAYRLKNRGDLRQVLLYLANEANEEMQEALPISQLEALVSSICVFMQKYTGRPQEDVVAYNKALAKARHDKAMGKILSVLETVSFKFVEVLSARKIAKMASTSNSTVSKHLTKIIGILRDRVLNNIRQSLVAFTILLLPNYQYNVTPNSYKVLNIFEGDSS